MKSSIHNILIVLLAIAAILATAPSAAARMPPPHIYIGQWRFQIRGDRPHPFGTCVHVPVSHFHIEWFQATGGGRWKYVSNFHIGSYNNGRQCFAVWNNYKPALCLRTCEHNRSGLEYIIRTALFMAAGAVGVTLTATAATILARALAVPIFLCLP